jgi:hypothetical protein
MLSNNGKFRIYASNEHRRLKIVKPAVAKAAETLKLRIEVAQTKKILPIYVYYRSECDEEEIPVYCDWGKDGNEEDVYCAIKNMMFVLSFHPRHSALQTVRKEICVLT